MGNKKCRIYAACGVSQTPTTITLYEDKNIIKMTVSGESIKGFSVPEEFLVFYYEVSEEEMNFYHSLVE